MSPMDQLYLRNAKKVECASAFPPTAISVTVKISKIVPKDSAVLIYTPPLADRPIQFNGPDWLVRYFTTLIVTFGQTGHSKVRLS